MGKHIKKLQLSGVSGTTLYSPALVKVVDGENSRLLLKKIGAADNELKITGSVLSELEIVQKGPAYQMIDLGLSVKWANMNIGAESEEQSGLYFAWGETSGFYGNAFPEPQETITGSGFAHDASKDSNNYHAYVKGDDTIYVNVGSGNIGIGQSVTDTPQEVVSGAIGLGVVLSIEEDETISYGPRIVVFSSDWYNSRPSASISTNITPDSGYDAARVNMGGTWRMPTKAEEQELLNSSFITKEVTTINGVSGTKFTSTKEGFTGNYIFVPFAGCGRDGGLGNVGSGSGLWSSSVYSSGSAWYSDCNSGGYRGMYGSYRCGGYSVRGVSE